AAAGWRGAGEGEQIHHAACAALGAATHPRTAARQRIPDHHSAGGIGGQGGGARGVQRERVLRIAGEPQGRRRQRHAGVARRENAELTPMQILNWNDLDAAGRRAALARARLDSLHDVEQLARSIIKEVRKDGDAALLRFAERSDRAKLDSLKVTPAEFDHAEKQLTAKQIAAIETAIDNVRRFHAAQLSAPLSMDVMPGVRCERVFRPVPAVGLYVPAGSAPLPSTVIMVAVPAQLAGCPQRVLCTPPAADGRANAAVLVAARRCGASNVF